MKLSDMLFANAMMGEGGGGGGGGSSDLTTATVEINYYTSDTEFGNCPVCWDDGAYSGTPEIANAYLEGRSGTFTVPLYKGTCIWQLPPLRESDNISITGNITIIEGTTLKITGNGTITIS